MPLTHTNRKGVTYTLYRATTATGRMRYVFAREPHGEPVETLPAGYVVRESVNGIVSLARDRPAAFSPDEVAAVQAALRRHPKAGLYRVEARPAHLAIYERLGPEADDLVAILREVGLGHAAAKARIEHHLEQAASYAPVLRFRLQDRTRRLFGVERRWYLGGDDEWLLLETTGRSRPWPAKWCPCSARRRSLSSGKPPSRPAAGKRSALERAYPSITRWVTAYGWVEIGPTEMSASFVRALDVGGMVWEGESTYASVDAALYAMEAALRQLLHDEFGER